MSLSRHEAMLKFLTVGVKDRASQNFCISRQLNAAGANKFVRDIQLSVGPNLEAEPEYI
jgi:hypothetical protein